MLIQRTFVMIFKIFREQYDNRREIRVIWVFELVKISPVSGVVVLGG